MTFPDAEGAVLDWLLEHPRMIAAGNKGVWFGVPSGTPPKPFITLARVGGGPVNGEIPLDQARISFSVWAGSKIAAASVAGVLVEVLHAMRTTPLREDAVGRGASDISVLWLPDPETKTPRYMVDATVYVTSA